MSKSGIKIAALGIALAALAGGAWYFGSLGTPSDPGSSKNSRRAAPAFSLKDAQGAERALADFKGKVVLVHFWATWCPPCLAEVPDLMEMSRRYSGTDLRIVAVSLDESWADAERIFPHASLPDTVVSLLDLEKKVPDRFGTFQYPESYLLDRQGRIILKLVGAQDWNSDRFKKLIDDALSGSPSASPADLHPG